MRRIRSFGAFWYDFIVGDDWRVAVGVGLLLGLTAVLASLSVTVWWLLPLGVVGILTTSVWRETRRARARL